MYRGQRWRLSRLMDGLDPDPEDDIIEIGAPDSMLRVRDCLARGEIVGILADRSTEPAQTISVPFLGDLAPFPPAPRQSLPRLDAGRAFFRGPHRAAAL